MNIVVCVKQVPSTNEVRLDPVTRTIIRDGRASVINPFDIFAIETAVQIKERMGGRVYALSMGIPATERLLRDAMARGVDEAVLLTDRAFAGSDTLATSYALSLGVKALMQQADANHDASASADAGKIDLIICGKMAVDGDTAQIGPELSAQLGIPCVTDVCEIMSVKEDDITVKKDADGGCCIVKVQLPALITVTKDAAQPRFPSIAGVRYSMTAPLRVLTADAAEADLLRCGLNGSPTQVVKTYTPDRSHKAQVWEGSAEDAAKRMMKLWREVH